MNARQRRTARRARAFQLRDEWRASLSPIARRVFEAFARQGVTEFRVNLRRVVPTRP